MDERIVEGLWDCTYCDTKGIGGLTKHCPRCGHPQDDDVKFYLGKKKNYLDADLAKEYGQGADWICPYCNSLNRVRYQYCSNCGAAKDSAEKDYFSDQVKKAEKKPEPMKSKKKKSKKKLWITSGVIFALFITILCAYWPRTYDATVATAAWTREIDIEAYRTVQESDWKVPDGGRVYDEKQEIHHYDQVLDHYETRTREVADEVLDGYDYETEYKDNGDGTFTEKRVSVPRYRTEYRTETYKEPIYRDEPRYATKYYYDIDKWVVDRTEESKGADDDPYWPEYTLAENERTGYQGAAYIVLVKTDKKEYSVPLSLEDWQTFKQGDTIEITVSAGTVIEINGIVVE